MSLKTIDDCPILKDPNNASFIPYIEGAFKEPASLLPLFDSIESIEWLGTRSRLDSLTTVRLKIVVKKKISVVDVEFTLNLAFDRVLTTTYADGLKPFTKSPKLSRSVLFIKSGDQTGELALTHHNTPEGQYSGFVKRDLEYFLNFKSSLLTTEKQSSDEISRFILIYFEEAAEDKQRAMELYKLVGAITTSPFKIDGDRSIGFTGQNAVRIHSPDSATDCISDPKLAVDFILEDEDIGIVLSYRSISDVLNSARHDRPDPAPTKSPAKNLERVKHSISFPYRAYRFEPVTLEQVQDILQPIVAVQLLRFLEVRLSDELVIRARIIQEDPKDEEVAEAYRTSLKRELAALVQQVRANLLQLLSKQRP